MLIEELFQLNEEQALAALLEAPLDMPAGAHLEEQLDILMHRIEYAKKALGIANKLKNPEDKKRHKSRIMTFLNQLRKLFNTVADKLEAEVTSVQAYAA